MHTCPTVDRSRTPDSATFRARILTAESKAWAYDELNLFGRWAARISMKITLFILESSRESAIGRTATSLRVPSSTAFSPEERLRRAHENAVAREGAEHRQRMAIMQLAPEAIDAPPTEAEVEGPLFDCIDRYRETLGV